MIKIYFIHQYQLSGECFLFLAVRNKTGIVRYKIKKKSMKLSELTNK